MYCFFPDFSAIVTFKHIFCVSKTQFLAQDPSLAYGVFYIGLLLNDKEQLERLLALCFRYE